jgi:hypothetical protein
MLDIQQIWMVKNWYYLDMIVIDEKFLVIKEINGYLVDMILINSFRSGYTHKLFKKWVIGGHLIWKRLNALMSIRKKQPQQQQQSNLLRALRARVQKNPDSKFHGISLLSGCVTLKSIYLVLNKHFY